MLPEIEVVDIRKEKAFQERKKKTHSKFLLHSSSSIQRDFVLDSAISLVVSKAKNNSVR
jgi:hypothetical protein